MDYLDHGKYGRFCGPQKLEKSIFTLVGIVEGIAADKVVSSQELELLTDWIQYHRPLEPKHPFNEVIPLLDEILADQIITEAEKNDLLWLGKKIVNGELHQSTKSDMQVLHGILQGIVADGVINAAEVNHLQDWMADNEQLRKMWPFDEIESLLVSVLSDGKIDDSEQKLLLDYFTDFVEFRGSQSPGEVQLTVTGICAVCPEIEFENRKFCITGASQRFFRSHFETVITNLGGVVKSSVTKDLDFLVIGANGNPCWAYSCYGRKVEQAMNMRRSGSGLLIVHENDLWDAIQDVGI